MQIDQTVISLRPGGCSGPRSTRFFAPRFESSSSSSEDSQIFHPAFKVWNFLFEGHECVRYTREQLLQLKEVVDTPEDILKIKQEIESEFAGEDQTWGRADGNVSLELWLL
ncbi:hypothetical protein CRYUN_Cryun26dG0005900 [Craigia yunnanensis]